uniref:Beta-catenin-interacting ICAT domain-containing protein n=1 Tax=Clastoptera arizonana TaxID=38151 RepID=A0A1B6CM10_9HEMI
MGSKGQEETKKLKKNLEEQLERLIQQLADLEECKEDMDLEEYEESKADTMDQLEELNKSLSKYLSGDITLVDELSTMQLATQAAISAAFQTPAVIRMFARREPQELRNRLCEIDRDIKLGRLSEIKVRREKVEILSALRHFSEKLSSAELQYLNENSNTKPNISGANFHFVKVTEESEIGEKALDLASNDVLSAQSNS